MWRAAACLVAGLLTVPLPAAAWDYPGHRIVGAIADLVLQQHFRDTHQRVRDLLARRNAAGEVENRSLSQVAVFPDCAKDEAQFCGRRPSTEEIDYVLRNLVHKSFHYTNSPFGQKAYRPDGVGAVGTDVVHMISYTVNQLRNVKQPPKQDVKLTQAEALWLLAHLVGDIHQPLHVGQAYYEKDCTTLFDPNDPANQGKEPIGTAGGNFIKFDLPRPAVPLVPGLHIYWDSTAVARAMHADGLVDAEQVFAKQLATKAPAEAETIGDPEMWAERWFAEMSQLAQEAYTHPGVKIQGKPDDSDRKCVWTVTLDETYEKWAQDLAREQLRKAGFRLAALLVAIFPNKKAHD
jgi:hypothetical protein